MGLKLHITVDWCGREGPKRCFTGAEDMCLTGAEDMCLAWGLLIALGTDIPGYQGDI